MTCTATAAYNGLIQQQQKEHQDEASPFSFDPSQRVKEQAKYRYRQKLEIGNTSGNNGEHYHQVTLHLTFLHLYLFLLSISSMVRPYTPTPPP